MNHAAVNKYVQSVQMYKYAQGFVWFVFSMILDTHTHTHPIDQKLTVWSHLDARSLGKRSLCSSMMQSDTKQGFFVVVLFCFVMFFNGKEKIDIVRNQKQSLLHFFIC